ncbi:MULTISPECIES: AI-2E family transporter [unclassified Haladaptatus]|uniref:AI-2E family transporter n=1 Tax=unclassified Haladaptatus TaxID=2622732 RepID=UPI00209BE3B5|nr:MULTISPECIES: AI-2E family transporter [unclassified Haladaptatus]MCO8244860.1 AI-2E family transporter [Haladaptatus sp. AB643]MCO8255626.1 AI-2E family transporter [Haladaptatus sp. AB618]
MNFTPERNRERVAWWLIFSALGILFAFILYSYVGTIVLGLFVYYATRPIYRRLRHRVQPRSLAAGLSLGTLAFPGILLLVYTVFVSIQQLRGLIGGSFDQYESVLGPYLKQIAGTQNTQVAIHRILSDPQRLTQFLDPQTASELFTSAGGYVGAVATGLLHVFIALIIAFYLLRDDQKLAHWFTSQISGTDSATHAFLEEVDTDLETIYFGNILNAFVVAIVAAITYTILNTIAPTGVAIPAAVLFGLLTGLASLIPIVGMKLVYVPVGLYLAARALMSNPQFIWFPFVFLLISAVIVDGLTEILLRPYISGRNLHVGLVLFAYILGPLLFGWYGLFFGPLLLVLFVHSTRIILPELLHGQELTPFASAADPIPDPDENVADESASSETADTKSAGEDSTSTSSEESERQNGDSDG